MALKDWEHIKAFEKDAVEAQHLDVAYILRQMMAQKAFYFTAMPTLVMAPFRIRIHATAATQGGLSATEARLSYLFTSPPLSSALLQQEEEGADLCAA